MFSRVFFHDLDQSRFGPHESPSLIRSRRWPRERLCSAGDQQRTFPRVLSHLDERRRPTGSERRHAHCRFSSGSKGLLHSNFTRCTFKSLSPDEHASFIRMGTNPSPSSANRLGYRARVRTRAPSKKKGSKNHEALVRLLYLKLKILLC